MTDILAEAVGDISFDHFEDLIYDMAEQNENLNEGTFIDDYLHGLFREEQLVYNEDYRIIIPFTGTGIVTAPTTNFEPKQSFEPTPEPKKKLKPSTKENKPRKSKLNESKPRIYNDENNTSIGSRKSENNTSIGSRKTENNTSIGSRKNAQPKVPKKAAKVLKQKHFRGFDLIVTSVTITKPRNRYDPNAQRSFLNETTV